MPREKEHYRDVVADIYAVTGKRLLGKYDVMDYLGVGYNKVHKYFGKEDKLTIFQLASKLL
jgi:hypothetical protein